jgi:hypothetical protein
MADPSRPFLLVIESPPPTRKAKPRHHKPMPLSPVNGEIAGRRKAGKQGYNDQIEGQARLDGLEALQPVVNEL